MELVYTTAFATHEQARLAVFEYIEVFYNRQRPYEVLDIIPASCGRLGVNQFIGLPESLGMLAPTRKSTARTME